MESGQPGRVFGPVLTQSSRIKDRNLGGGVKLKGKEALQFALEEAMAEGVEFRLEDHFTDSTSTRFSDRKHEPDDYEGDEDA